MWFLVLFIVLIICGVICFIADFIENTSIKYFVGAVSFSLLMAFILFSVGLQVEKDFCKIIKQEKIEIKYKVFQGYDGRYFAIDSNYNKKYRKVRITNNNTVIVKNYYKQKNIILDWMLLDFTEEVLYLNLNDIEKIIEGENLNGNR